MSQPATVPQSKPVIPASDIIEVAEMAVACDGGNSALGHPRVWLHIDPESHDVVCPYCSRRYVLGAH